MWLVITEKAGMRIKINVLSHTKGIMQPAKVHIWSFNTCRMHKKQCASVFKRKHDMSSTYMHISGEQEIM